MKKEKSYRKIWLDHFGPIPIDNYGRSFEIHHINGDHYDNRIENLQCLSILDHLKIHLEQGDFLAASSIAQRINLSEEDMAILSKKGGIEARDKKLGIHSLSIEDRRINGAKGAKAIRGMNWYHNGYVSKKFRVEPDLSIWTRGCLPRGTGPKKGSNGGVFWNKDGKNIRSNSHPGAGWKRGKYLTSEQLERRKEIASSITKTEQQKKLISIALLGRPKPIVTCPYCDKTGGKSAMERWHFNNCKENKNACN